MNKVWMCSGSTYTQVGSGYKVSESLPVGIYSISLTMTGYHLDKYAVSVQDVWTAGRFHRPCNQNL